MTTIVKCFSVLVAAGEGQRCNDLREILRAMMLQSEISIGKSKVWLHKHGRTKYPDLHLALRKEIALECNYLYLDIPKQFFVERLNASS